MADVLSTDEQVNLLFKKLLNKPCTNLSRKFFEEPNIVSRNYVYQEDILAFSLPSSAPSDLVGLTDTSTDDNGRPLKGSYAGKTSAVDTNIRYYHKIPLEYIHGTAGASFQAQAATTSHPGGYGDVAGTSSSNLGIAGAYGRVLQGSIPFNQAVDGSYGVTVYTSTYTAIPFGTAGGGWIVDSRPGVVTFFILGNLSTVSDTMVPYISFFRYVGSTGGVSASDVTHTVTSTSNTYTTPQTFYGGAKNSTTDQVAAIQIDTRSVGSLATNELLNALQFGGDFDGSWRLCVEKTNAGSALLVQAREGGVWDTKALFSTP